MIALKPVKLYEVPKAKMSEDISEHFELACISEGTDKKGPRVLEQRLYAARKELEQQSREHNRLLEMIRIQTARLSVIEPLPGLFLSRVEELLYLIDPKLKDGVLSEPITTSDELDKRFNRGIAQLRLLLNRDHVLENKELLEELAQTKSALQLKRDEAFQLRVEQEQLNQRLTSIINKLERFDVEIAAREDRIAKLQKHVKESEAKHHKLFVDRRSIRNRSGTGAAAFSFTSNWRESAKRKQQTWQIASIVVGLICGFILTLAGVWIRS